MAEIPQQDDYISGWLVDLAVGFCTHESGASVYFDPTLTKSGGIRCVGPFFCETFEPIEHALSDLVCYLESELNPGYVVWGGYQDSVTVDAPSIDVLGVPCGFVPKFGIRGRLLHKSCDLAREWVLVEGEAHHRSGLPLDQNQGVVPLDNLLLHPLTLRDDIATMQTIKPLITSYLCTKKVIGLIR